MVGDGVTGLVGGVVGGGRMTGGVVGGGKLGTPAGKELGLDKSILAGKTPWPCGS